jgi:hypothetical protein
MALVGPHRLVQRTLSVRNIPIAILLGPSGVSADEVANNSR